MNRFLGPFHHQQVLVPEVAAEVEANGVADSEVAVLGNLEVPVATRVEREKEFAGGLPDDLALYSLA